MASRRIANFLVIVQSLQFLFILFFRKSVYTEIVPRESGSIHFFPPLARATCLLPPCLKGVEEVSTF